MKKQSRLIYSVMLLLGDFLAVLAAFAAAYIWRVRFDPRPLVNPMPAEAYLDIFILLVPFWMIIFFSLGLYRREVWINWWREAWLLLVGTFAGVLFIIGYDFITDQPVFPARLVAVYALLIGFGLLLVERNAMRILRRLALRFGIGTTRVMLIGDTPVTRELGRQLIESRSSGYHVSAIVASNRNLPPDFTGQHFRSLTQALKALDDLNIESVIQTQLSPKSADNEAILAETTRRHLEYRFVPEHGTSMTSHSELELFAGWPMLTLHQTRLVGWGQIFKRTFDFLLASILVILLSPLFLVIALLIKVRDPGPVFFRQKRLTRYGKAIRIIKFRTMSTAYSGRDPAEVFTEMGRPELIREYQENRAKVENDPRVSSIGHWLRNTSLDELPQLFNVIGGSLSLVGPRAIPEEEITYFKDHGALVLKVKTGITGLAQVTGRSDISLDERLRLDLYYVQNWSVWLDVKILFKTVITVLARRGAQ